MALVVPEVLVPPKYLESTLTAQYLSSGAVTRIDKCTVTNVGSVNVSADLHIASATAGLSNKILDSRTIAPGETYLCPEVVGQVLGSGASLYGVASVASALVIAVAGRKFT